MPRQTVGTGRQARSFQVASGGSSRTVSSSLVEFGGPSVARSPVDLTGCTEIRLRFALNSGAAAGTGAQIGLHWDDKYLGFDPKPLILVDVSTGGGDRTTEWQPIPEGADRDLYVTFSGVGGDGTGTLTTTNVSLDYR